MALMILVVITILYLGNFYLLAHEYLKVVPVITPRIRVFMSDLSRNNMAEFVRQLQSLQQNTKTAQIADKVNWKEEGF